MVDPPSQPRPVYTQRALGVVAVGGILHLTLAHALLSLHLRAVSVPDDGLAAGVTAIVAATLVTSLAAAYLGTQYGSADRVTRSVTIAMRIAPAGWAALLLPVILPVEALGGAWDLVRVTAPALASAWVSALLVALVVARALHALAIRVPTRMFGQTAEIRDAPKLGGSYAAALTTAAACAALVAAAVVVSTTDLDLRGEEATTLWAPALGLLALVLLGAAAGRSLGQSPGKDLLAIAGRLDKLGHATSTEMARPFVATSADEIGELLTRLEGLRAHLDQELQLYEDALDKTKQADALKSDFLSAVSHELRTPLNAVGGFAQLLLEGGGDELSEAQAEDVRLIQAGGKQLLELINDILDISMIESGDLRLHFGETDVGAVIQEVVRSHRPLLRDTEVQLQCELGPHVPNVVCDRRRITQILTNLMSNAIKFTESGSIMLRAAFDPREETVVIRCIDTGVGIAPDELDSIFEEYRQVGSVKRRKKGTGLGLAIARSIAAHHGGSLTVESELGKGSTFTLTLPVDPPMRPKNIDVAIEAARSRVRAERRNSPMPGSAP